MSANGYIIRKEQNFRAETRVDSGIMYAMLLTW